MTMIQIIILVAGSIFFFAVCLAVYGMFSPGPDYMPMSPDAEYQWLTEDMNLDHDAAMEIVNMRLPGG